MEENIMNFKEAMSFLKIPRSTLYKLVQEGRVPAVKVGRHWRFSKSTLELWISGDEFDISAHSAVISSLNRKFCWEIKKAERAEDHDCTKCLIYRTRALNCFIMRSELDDKISDEEIQCDGSCRDCSYYQEHFV